MPRLKIVSGGDAGKSVELPSELVAGRDGSNDLRLHDETCSRHHARFLNVENRVVVVDLDSNNGTFVNGEKVREHLLQEGDRILIGRTQLVFESGKETGNRLTVHVKDFETRTVTVKESRGTDAPVADPGAHLRRLYEIAGILNASLKVPELLDGLCGQVLEALDADTAIALVDGEAEPAVRRRDGRGGTAAVSRAVLERARTNREALLVSCVPDDEALRGRESLVEEGVSSVLCTPLLHAGRLLGILYADSRREDRAFGSGDLEFLRAVSHLAAPALDHALQHARARTRVSELDAQVNESYRAVAADAKMLEVLELARKVSAADSTVLLTGESGTGKEVLARAIHDASPRRSGPFVPLNCAALVESLLESELFGHEKGAFTGAVRARPGRIETAEGGTLFLDEIGELSPAFQAKLLRVLQDRTFYRVGGTQLIRVDTRFVAATNRDLQAAIRESRFREDLYYRLSVVSIRIPPLRERPGDIPLLAHHFLERVRQRTKRAIRSISEGALESLRAYGWPGNVRELENVIERAAILADGESIDERALPAEIRTPSPAPPGELPVNLEEAEKVCIRRALELTGGKKGEAAKLLGISWPTLNKKIKKYGLD